ncbi:anti-sigma factor [Pedobacter sp. HMWF019]|uniref:FecR family protein n=1 Tax=Pedobacter sp. HMWF019 TaxID=2056856 RepID=UPI000D3BDB15|nr:FecR family protein [Pedobacter sp. HMWF019]PTS99968.1 anti-sigma factor [Pedobacter sp. HMWF019]
MKKPIKELFVRFIANRCDPSEIEQVRHLLNNGGYEEEWQQAMKEREQEIILPPSLAPSLEEGKLLLKIQETIHSKPIVVQSNPKPWKWLSAAAVLLMTLSIGVWYFRSGVSPEGKLVAHKEIPAAKEQALHKWIKLPDGSSVQLNNDSKLEYPDSFEGQQNREVTLTGEAYFDVKHNSSQPFIIHTGKIKTTVLGTAFNIKAYQSGSAVTVTVTRGRVKVEDDQKVLAILTPNQQLAWNTQTQIPAKVKVDAEQVVEWKKQDLIMDDVSLEDAAKLIEERYSVKVHFNSDKVKSCKFTAAFLNRNEITQVLNVIGDITGAKIILKNNIVTIDGNGC